MTSLKTVGALNQKFYDHMVPTKQYYGIGSDVMPISSEVFQSYAF